MSQIHELERQLLGSFFNWPRTFNECADITRADHFTLGDHRKAFSSMAEIDSAGEEINVVSLMARGVPADVCEALSEHGSRLGVPYLAETLAMQYASRIAAVSLAGLAAKSKEVHPQTGIAVNDPTGIADELKALTAKIEEAISPAIRCTVQGDLHAYADHLERVAQGESPRIPSGIVKLDAATGGGYEPGDLVLLGGQPRTGKTSLVCNAILAGLEQNIPQGFIECEMTRTQIYTRLNSIHVNRSKDAVRSGREYAELNLPFIQWMYGKPFQFYEADDRHKNPQSVRREIERMARAGCRIVYFDYLQAARERNGKKSEYESVSDFVTMLRGMALRLNVVIVALASLNREVNERTGRATLSSFRGSGELEFNASIALMLHRVSKDGEEPEGIRKLELDILKNREGRDGTIRLEFNLPTQRITEESAGYSVKVPTATPRSHPITSGEGPDGF